MVLTLNIEHQTLNSQKPFTDFETQQSHSLQWFNFKL